MNEIIASVFIWTAATLGILPIMQPPEAHVLDDKAFMEKVCAVVKPCDGVAAFYFVPEKTIYIRKSVGVDTDEGKSYLVHEMVHYFQDVLETNPPPCFDEAEAYFVQDIWRHQKKLKTITNTPKFNLFIGTCVMSIVSRGAM